MAALNFPTSPTAGQRYPADPGTIGVAQWEWDNVVGVWNTVSNFVRLNNQSAFNGYAWPNTDGGPGQQLETDGAGNLYWDAASDPTLVPLGLLQAFDGIVTSFTIINPATLAAYTPTPSSNLVVILGGVLQTPNTAYTVTGSTLNFTNPPLAGTDFVAFTVEQQ